MMEGKNFPSVETRNKTYYIDLYELFEDTQQKYNMVPYAIKYAKLGWKIFQWNTDESSITDPELGLMHGVKDASNNFHKIERIWHRRKKANIGWMIPEGFLVIDCDVLKDRNKTSILNQNGNVIPLSSLFFYLQNKKINECNLFEPIVKDYILKIEKIDLFPCAIFKVSFFFPGARMVPSRFFPSGKGR